MSDSPAPPFLPPPIPPPASPNPDNDGVLREVSELQNRKTSWGTIVIILIVSLGLFVGAGARQFSWDYLLILVPVVFIHELGHYLAMRAFNYRNLRMFFIPFFGAAVSGQHYNVAGWKKVVVSLMGPVPGIFLGSILGIIGLIAGKALVIKIALVALFLNGFNLLPLLPFDGGRVFQTLLFSRHPALDLVFRVLAVIGLGALAAVLHSISLGIVAFFMFVSLSVSYRLATIARDVRALNLPPPLPDEQSIPPATADVIIGELRKIKGPARSDKILAQQTLQVFETVNTRPPGAAATIGLLAVHFFSFVMALLLAMILILGRKGNLLQRIEAASRAPKNAIVCGTSESWNGSRSMATDSAPRFTLVSTLKSHSAAQTLFADLTNRLPATASLRIFGQSLLVSLPAQPAETRGAWLAELKGRSSDSVADETNQVLHLALRCRAPDAASAKRIAAEIEAYLRLPDSRALTPPWLPSDIRTSAERAQNELARATYAKLLSAQSRIQTNAELKALEKQFFTELRQGDRTSGKALKEKVAALRAKLRDDAIEWVAAAADGPVDTNIVAWFPQYYTNRAGTNATPRKLLRDFTHELGELPPGQRGVGSPSGFAKTLDSSVDILWIAFNRASDGAPAFVDWLCARGCRNFKYEFYSQTVYDEDEVDEPAPAP